MQIFARQDSTASHAQFKHWDMRRLPRALAQRKPDNPPARDGIYTITYTKRERRSTYHISDDRGGGVKLV